MIPLSILKNSGYFILVLLVCAFEICSFFFIGFSPFYFLLSLFIIHCWFFNNSIFLLYCTFFLGVESFIIYQTPFLFLTYSIVIALLSHFLKTHLYIQIWQPIATLFLVLWINTYNHSIIINNPFYTGSIICGNLLIIGIFSLKYGGGKTRQSLTSFG